jgi:hypothetical protein
MKDDENKRVTTVGLGGKANWWLTRFHCGRYDEGVWRVSTLGKE